MADGLEMRKNGTIFVHIGSDQTINNTIYMKKILIFAAALFVGISAAAQTFYVGGTADDGVKVLTSNGKVLEYAGTQLAGLGANSKGAWVLVQSEPVAARLFYSRSRTSDMSGWAKCLGTKFNDKVNNPRKVRDGWGSYVLWNENSIYKTYKYTDEKKCIISSIAMKIKGNDVVVAGTYAKDWGGKYAWYWGMMWGEVNGKMIYGNPNSSDGWQRKSLKRKYFKGFEEPTRSLENIGYPEYDTDGTFTSVYHVNAVDYMDGKIYTTGWGEREYTYYHVNTAQDWYYVRRCARCWENGEEKVKQYENKTSAAYTLTMGGTASNPIYYTAGHLRGQPMGWTANEDIYTKDMNGAVSREAIITVNNSIKRFFIVGEDLCVNDGKSIKVANAKQWLDVVAYNNEIYALCCGVDRTKYTVYKVDPVNYTLYPTSFKSVEGRGINADQRLAIY